MNWLIWNRERGMWWKQGRRGYTTLTHLAERCTEDEAKQIVADSRDDDIMLWVPWTTWAKREFDVLRAREGDAEREEDEQDQWVGKPLV
jgi:hypothetical protein